MGIWYHSCGGGNQSPPAPPPVSLVDYRTHGLIIIPHGRNASARDKMAGVGGRSQSSHLAEHRPCACGGVRGVGGVLFFFGFRLGGVCCVAAVFGFWRLGRRVLGRVLRLWRGVLPRLFGVLPAFGRVLLCGLGRGSRLRLLARRRAFLASLRLGFGRVAALRGFGAPLGALRAVFGGLPLGRVAWRASGLFRRLCPRRRAWLLWRLRLRRRRGLFAPGLIRFWVGFRVGFRGSFCSVFLSVFVYFGR